MQTIVLTGRPSHRATVGYSPIGPCAASCNCGGCHSGAVSVFEWYTVHLSPGPTVCSGSNGFVHEGNVGVRSESLIVTCPTCHRFAAVSPVPGEPGWWTINAHRTLP